MSTLDVTPRVQRRLDGRESDLMSGEDAGFLMWDEKPPRVGHPARAALPGSTLMVAPTHHQLAGHAGSRRGRRRSLQPFQQRAAGDARDAAAPWPLHALIVLLVASTVVSAPLAATIGWDAVPGALGGVADVREWRAFTTCVRIFALTGVLALGSLSLALSARAMAPAVTTDGALPAWVRWGTVLAPTALFSAYFATMVASTGFFFSASSQTALSTVTAPAAALLSIGWCSLFGVGLCVGMLAAGGRGHIERLVSRQEQEAALASDGAAAAPRGKHVTFNNVAVNQEAAAASAAPALGKGRKQPDAQVQPMPSGAAITAARAPTLSGRHAMLLSRLRDTVSTASGDAACIIDGAEGAEEPLKATQHGTDAASSASIGANSKRTPTSYSWTSVPTEEPLETGFSDHDVGRQEEQEEEAAARKAASRARGQAAVMGMPAAKSVMSPVPLRTMAF